MYRGEFEPYYLMIAGIDKLGAMNTHITALMEAQKQRGMCAAPRQSAGQAMGSCTQAPVCGVSGFAFQGTNAHALLQVQLQSSPAPLQPNKTRSQAFT